MNRLEEKLVHIDDFLWHLTNVGVGVALFVFTLLYVQLGSHELNLIVIRIDIVYVLIPLSVVYTCWTGIDLWNWYSGSDQ